LLKNKKADHHQGAKLRGQSPEQDDAANARSYLRVRAREDHRAHDARKVAPAPPR
jgi:hypothetical protein